MLPLSLHYFCCAVKYFAENSAPGSSSLREASHTLSRSDTEHGAARAQATDGNWFAKVRSEEGTQMARKKVRGCLSPILLAWAIRLLNNLRGEGKNRTHNVEWIYSHRLSQSGQATGDIEWQPCETSSTDLTNQRSACFPASFSTKTRIQD